MVLMELTEYVGKTGGFAHNYLWEDVIQKPTNCMISFSIIGSHRCALSRLPQYRGSSL